MVAPTETGLGGRVELVKRADRAARAYDARIFQVQVVYADNLRHMLVATSDGTLSHDRQPLTRVSVSALAREGAGPPQRGTSGGGGRVGLEFFDNDKTPEYFAREAARQAVLLLDCGARAGRRNDRGAGPGLARHPGARSRGPRSGGRLQPQGRLGFQRSHRRAGGRARCAPLSTTAPSRTAAAR